MDAVYRLLTVEVLWHLVGHYNWRRLKKSHRQHISLCSWYVACWLLNMLTSQVPVPYILHIYFICYDHILPIYFNVYRENNVRTWMASCFCAHGKFILVCFIPSYEATREINTKTTLEWAQTQFVTVVHTSFNFLHDIRIHKWWWKRRSSNIDTFSRSHWSAFIKGC